MRDDFAEALPFRAVFAEIGTVTAADDEEPLPIETVAVVAVELDTAPDAVLGDGARAAGDGRQPRQRPAHAQQAIASLAAVAEGKLGFDAAVAGRNLDRQRVSCGSGFGDTELPAHVHRSGKAVAG